MLFLENLYFLIHIVIRKTTFNEDTSKTHNTWSYFTSNDNSNQLLSSRKSSRHRIQLCICYGSCDAGSLTSKFLLFLQKNNSRQKLIF